jgi:DNA-binding transcriptional regulator YiaG
MIKTDSQLQRTLDDIKRFSVEFESSARIVDELERELVSSSLRGTITKLLMEVSKYRDAKAGRVRIPERLKSIHELCPYITSIRIALGWTQENLADQLTVTRQCVNKWEEHNYSDLDADTLDRVVSALGLHTLIEVNHDSIQLVRPLPAPEFNFDRELAAAVAA